MQKGKKFILAIMWATNFQKKLHILFLCNEHNCVQNLVQKDQHLIFQRMALVNGGHIGGHFGKKTLRKIAPQYKGVCTVCQIRLKQYPAV